MDKQAAHNLIHDSAKSLRLQTAELMDKSLPQENIRKVIHCDCDCFYAAVEVRDKPSLQGRPVAVGGSGRRGVISTCNYEARRFGVRSAMPTYTAIKHCPDLMILPARFDVYKKVSQQIQKIFSQYTDVIEPLSLDEAFLDVTGSEYFFGSATRIAEAIRAEVENKVGITISAGVAPNKFLAKIASDWKKPNGLFVITPEQVDSFVKHLPIEKIFGVGKVTASKLKNQGLYTCGDIRKMDLAMLIKQHGKFGKHLWKLAHGEDDREVVTERDRKSLSVEHTYFDDLPDEQACLEQLSRLTTELDSRLTRAKESKPIHKAFVKLKFNDFSTTTMECMVAEPALKTYQSLCKQAYARGNKPVRLLGLGVRFAEGHRMLQMPLYPELMDIPKLSQSA